MLESDVYAEGRVDGWIARDRKIGRCRRCDHFEEEGWCNLLDYRMKADDYCSKWREGDKDVGNDPVDE